MMADKPVVNLPAQVTLLILVVIMMQPLKLGLTEQVTLVTFMLLEKLSLVKLTINMEP